MNIPEFIKSFTSRDLPILDCNSQPFSVYNTLVTDLGLNDALFIIGGLPLVYQLIKERIPVLIAEEDRNISIVLPNEKDCQIITSMIPRMLSHNYWEYIELWNRQGNRNIIAAPKLLRHILWNRFNPNNIKFYDSI